MIKNFAKVLLSNGIVAIIGIVNSFVFPLILSTSDYATYQQYMLYISYVNICHLGIASGMFLNYAGKDYKSIEKSRYKSEIFLLFIALLLFTTVGLCISMVNRSTIIVLTVFSIFPYCIIMSFQSLYQAWERFTAYSIINFLPKLLSTVAIIILYFLGLANGFSSIISYLIIIWIFAIYFIAEFWGFTRRIKPQTVLSKENIRTGMNGFLIMLGNYVNILFHSIDKQFVLSLYSKESFALYSFAMSLQNIMMMFITALANPFYPRLAKGDIDKNAISSIKELLFVFGTYSGCAYFAVSFVVRNYVAKYVGSLSIAAMFFAVFPAMAVINVLYINLYKIQKKLKLYLFTLFGMLIVAAIANTIAIIFKGDYIRISLATMICYYIWLFFSQKHFDEIKITIKDCGYLLGCFVIYFSVTQFVPDSIIGFGLYAVIVTVWNWVFYRSSLTFLKSYIFHK